MSHEKIVQTSRDFGQNSYMYALFKTPIHQPPTCTFITINVNASTKTSLPLIIGS